jgi:hypothetical protein
MASAKVDRRGDNEPLVACRTIPGLGVHHHALLDDRANGRHRKASCSLLLPPRYIRLPHAPALQSAMTSGGFFAAISG